MHALPRTVVSLNAAAQCMLGVVLSSNIPWSYTGVTAQLVDENTSVRVQQCAHIVDKVLLVCVMPAALTLDCRFRAATTPVCFFLAVFLGTGIIDTKKSREYHW